MRLRRKAVDIVVVDDGSDAGGGVALATAPAPPVDLPAPMAEPAAAPDLPMRTLPIVASTTPIQWVAPGTGDVPPVAPTYAPSRIGDMLVARGLISAEQLEHALAEQVASGKRLGSQLVDLGSVSERELVEVVAEQVGSPVADLRQQVPEEDAVARFPEDVARRYEVVPVRIVDGALEVAIADMLTDELRATFETATGCRVVPLLAPPSEIRRAIDQAYMALDGVEQQVRAFEDFASSRQRVESETQLVVDEQAPVVQVVTMLLTQAVRDRASDIHLEPQDGSVRIRFRIDGVLREISTLPDSMAQALISRLKVMADMNIVERRRPQDGQIQTTVDERPLDIRVATTSTIWGEKAVLRILDKTRSLRALGALGMTPHTSHQFSALISSPFGMVICAGPTGSGKTTSLYAAIKEINTPDRNITTIEDPVEYVMPDVNQIQVNAQAGITFADGLKSILRQDPDVILVGEVRDVETARIAVQSALTGHLVLSSLHATDAATALQRLRDMGIEPFLITSAVTAVMSQRLLRKICTACRERYEPSGAERAYFEQRTGTTKVEFWRGAGCNVCSHSGYQGRVGIYELLPVTEPIKDLIVGDAGYEELRALAVSEGMHTLRDEALRLINQDVTTIAEVIRTIYVG